MVKNLRHYERSVKLNLSAKDIFNYIDDHTRLSSHMNKTSWMMAGAKMETKIDDGKGQKVGSHILMSGKILGLKLALDEVVTRHDPPNVKEWETVGSPRLLIIGNYKMGFEIKEENEASTFKVFISYDLPNTFIPRMLGYLLSGFYAKWCVGQMVEDTINHFSKEKN